MMSTSSFADTNGSPTVSVIIPTYNRAELLSRALESVLAQTFEDFEVLVVDDGSTDETAALMAKYEAKDPRIRYLVQPQNAGVSAARNRGLREARGEYIAFLDSDDEWLPEKLERQVTAMEKAHENVGLIYTGVESVFIDGRRVDLPEYRGDLYRDLLLQNVIHGGGSNVMIRRAAIERVGFFDEMIPAIEDYDYWLRVASHFEVDFISQPLIRYHDPDGVERKSLNVEENLDAHAYLYRKHKAAMREARVAHLVLIAGAHRYLSAGETAGAFRNALRAIAAQPAARAPYGFLLWLLKRTLQRRNASR